jgi:hypothetical protein
VDRRLDVKEGGLGFAADGDKNAQNTNAREPQFALTCHVARPSG